MYETSTALNPVAGFEFYLGKIHPDCKALFQTPNKATNKNMNFASAQHWSRNEPLEKNTKSKMMERISIKAELSEWYTNHCICASTVTSLFQFQHGVDARKICAICAKHKDERSLTHYINETTSAQKRECSKILRDTFQPQLAVKQEASGITRQNVAGPSADPTSNSNPQSLLQNQFVSLAQSNQNCIQHI